MQTKDHKMLAEFLIHGMKYYIPPFYIKAFLLGSVEPDINKFTYLHGLIRGEKFHGHNYENIMPVMKKLFYSIEKKQNLGIREYYHLGKLMHYIADAFTFPHNRMFKGNLRDHWEYEEELHQKFNCLLPKRKIERKFTTSCDFRCIEILHEEYLQNACTYEDDCKYILNATEMIFLEVTQKYPQRNCMKVGTYRENYIV